MMAAGPPAAAAGARGVVMEAVRQAERARREVEGLVGRLAEAQVEAQKVRAARDETAGRARVERAKLEKALHQARLEQEGRELAEKALWEVRAEVRELHVLIEEHRKIHDIAAASGRKVEELKADLAEANKVIAQQRLDREELEKRVIQSHRAIQEEVASTRKGLEDDKKRLQRELVATRRQLSDAEYQLGLTTDKLKHVSGDLMHEVKNAKEHDLRKLHLQLEDAQREVFSHRCTDLL